MSLMPLVFAEIRFRFTNFVLCALAVVVAATMFVAGPMLLTAYSSHVSTELAQLQSEADGLQQAADSQKQKTEDAKAEMKVAVDDLVKKTRRIMRDIGVNLRIVHKDTNMGSLYTDLRVSRKLRTSSGGSRRHRDDRAPRRHAAAPDEVE